MKVPHLFILPLLLSLTYTLFGQSIDVETERGRGAKMLTIKSFNSCCAQKGYKAIYHFDDNGRATKSSNYFKKRLLASYEYHYNDKGMLIAQIQTYSINHKNSNDTTLYIYKFDTAENVVSKTTDFGNSAITDLFSDYNTFKKPQTTTRLFRIDSTVTKIQYNAQGQEILIQRFEDGKITHTEERRFNQYGDKVYSNMPTLLDQRTGKMVMLVGGDRHAISETYEYTYDKQKRWTKKYVVFNNKKILLEKRKYR